MISREKYLKEFLGFFWLRPENAILLSLRAEKYAETLKFFDEDSIDISCGDGVFSFITLGGVVEFSSDMFQSINISQRRKDNFDAFDHFDETYNVKVSKYPLYRYKIGTDWKKNLLRKAANLSLYEKLIQHDNNYPLPLSNDSFGYIYSNSAYWVDNLEGHLKDLVRITKPGGIIVLELKTSNIKNYTAQRYASSVFGDQFCSIIDAGRLGTWKGLRGFEDYNSLIENIDGVKIRSIQPIYGDLLAYIWDIGLRPLFNPLVKLANSVDESTRLEAKREWCEIFYDLFADYISTYEAEPSSAIEWIVVLSKN